MLVRVTVRCPLLCLLCLCASLALSACGGGLEGSQIEEQVKDEQGNQNPLGFPLLATKNTTRVPGEEPLQDAAAAASAVYPGFREAQRPQAVTLVDEDDWEAAIAASVLMAPPLRAPVLLTQDGDVPEITANTLLRMKPKGAPLAGRRQAFLIGGAGAPEGLRAQRIRGEGGVELAAAIDSFAFRVTGSRSSAVVIASATDPRFAMPAAAWAAKSGDSVLFAGRSSLPAATRRALERRDRPAIYVLGPESVISDTVVRRLRRLGRVRRIGGRTPVENAVQFARFSDGTFGWGLRDPGHGLVFANAERPLDAAAAAPLAASGKYGPLLLTDSAERLPPALESFLLDIQPGYQSDPVRGVYNHAWLLGDESAINVEVQGRIDELAEIVRVRLGQPQ